MVAEDLLQNYCGKPLKLWEVYRGAEKARTAMRAGLSAPDSGEFGRMEV